MTKSDAYSPPRSAADIFALFADQGARMALTAASLSLAAHAALAEDTKAVESPNVKLDGGGGLSGDMGMGYGAVSGAVNLPWSLPIGVQLDALGGARDTEALWGLGGHAFWRDPETGLVGLTSSYTALGSDGAWRLGAEAEIYLSRFTLSASGGYQTSLDGQTGYWSGGVGYYPLDDLRLSAGAMGYGDTVAGRFGGEYQIPLSPIPGVSFYVDGAYGNGDYRQVLGGIRLHLGGGGKRSLIDRHRRDDPVNPLALMASHTALGIEAERKHDRDARAENTTSTESDSSTSVSASTSSSTTTSSSSSPSSPTGAPGGLSI